MKINAPGRYIVFSLGVVLLALFSFATVQLNARSKPPQQTPSAGFIVSVPAPEQEVRQAVQDVVADGIIQGSKEYNKDEYIGGAEAADSTSVFPPWTGSGQVFYKVRKNALDPRNFKDSGDSGTLAVRYVVQAGDEKNTVLRIDAIFVDDFHRRPHASNGSVEAAEYAAIQNHLASMQLQKQRATEDEHVREMAAKELERKQKQQTDLSLEQAPGESLEQHVRNLRREAERLVRSPGGQLRSAPYRSAASLKTLPPGTQVVILISTPYWYGVETEDGEHGWLHRSELERLP
jgi:Bacterial SH3 domain